MKKDIYLLTCRCEACTTVLKILSGTLFGIAIGIILRIAIQKACQ